MSFLDDLFSQAGAASGSAFSISLDASIVISQSSNEVTQNPATTPAPVKWGYTSQLYYTPLAVIEEPNRLFPFFSPPYFSGYFLIKQDALEVPPFQISSEGPDDSQNPPNDVVQQVGWLQLTLTQLTSDPSSYSVVWQPVGAEQTEFTPEIDSTTNVLYGVHRTEFCVIALSALTVTMPSPEPPPH